VIGAAAMAVHGIVRSTADLDVLVTDASCLDAAAWDSLRARGVDVDVKTGDAADPLAGVVRCRAAGEPPLDVVVGRAPWQRELLARAVTAHVGPLSVAVATPADLVLLKLYAGGPLDAWDVEQLLAARDRAALIAEVESRLAPLPDDARRLWRRIVDPGAR
jgi:hypothetical protein